MDKTQYEVIKIISDKIATHPNITPETKEQDVTKFIKRTLNSMASLFDVIIQDEKTKKYHIPDVLATIVKIEVLYRKQKDTPKTKKLTTLIDYIMKKDWDKIKADDLRFFFDPFFNPDYKEDAEYFQNFEDSDNKEDAEYFQDFKDKLYFCLDYYSKINPYSIPPYLQDDIVSFINCIYSKKKLPTRDYKKLLEAINSGEI